MHNYGKTRGHHCWWLTKNGKSLANFDDEHEVDAIIDLEQTQIEIAKNALSNVAKELTEESRIPNTAKNFAVAIVLNEASELER